MTSIKWLLTIALSIMIIALGAMCRYKSGGILANDSELFLSLALVIAFGVHERRNENGTHDKN